jgi:hypothetical protein
VEDIKRFVISNSTISRPLSNRRSLRHAFLSLIEERVITEAKKEEIISLVNYRNIVAHELPFITTDLSGKTYDKTALDRVRYYSNLLRTG